MYKPTLRDYSDCTRFGVIIKSEVISLQMYKIYKIFEMKILIQDVTMLKKKLPYIL